MTKKLFKTLAIALAAITLSLPLSTQALAAGRQDGHAPQKVEVRNDKKQQPQQSHKDNHQAQKAQVHKDNHQPQKVQVRQDSHRPNEVQPLHKESNRPHDVHPMHSESYRPAPKQEKQHSTTGNFVTGAIIGAVLGAIIANNT